MRSDLSRLTKRLRLPFWHRQDIEAEFESHLKDAQNEMHAQGKDQAEARRSALERLGDLDSLGDSLHAVHQGWIGGATVQRRFARVLLMAALILFAGIGLIATVQKVGHVARSRDAGRLRPSSPGIYATTSGSEFRLLAASEPFVPFHLNFALRSLGLDVQRFAYTVPFRHRITFQYEEYLDGKRHGALGASSTVMDAGEHEVMFSFRTEAEKFEFGDCVDTACGGSTLSRSLREYVSKYLSVDPGAWLAYGKTVPVLIFAADRHRSRGVDFQVGDALRDVAAKHDFVLAVFARIDRASKTK